MARVYWVRRCRNFGTQHQEIVSRYSVSRIAGGSGSGLTSTSQYPPDNSQIAVSLTNGAIEIRDIKSGSCFRTLQSGSREIRSLIFSPNGQWLVEGLSEVRIWDLASGKCLHQSEPSSDFWTYPGWKPRITLVAFLADGRLLALAVEHGVIEVRDTINMSNNCCRKFYHLTMQGLDYVSFFPNGEHLLATSGFSWSIWDINIASGSCLARWSDTTLWYMNSMHSHLAASCLRQLEIEALSGYGISQQGSSMRTPRVQKPHESCVEYVAFSPDFRWLISNDNRGVLKMWDVESQRCLHELEIGP